MILVDVYVPVIDKVYDFHLDENAVVWTVIEDMADMFCQKEQCRLGGAIQQLTLWLAEAKMKLDKDGTLFENGIHSGKRLMLL